MLIQVDVDATLYSANSLFSKVAKEEFDMKLPSEGDLEYWGHYDEFVDDIAKLKKVFRKAHTKKWVRRSEPYKGAAECLRWLGERDDHEIVYLSDRHAQARGPLLEWLQEHDFPVTDPEHVMTSRDKRDWMREYRPDIVIDDRVRTIALARYEIGAEVFSIEHSWNINLRNEIPGVYLVHSWTEMFKLMSRMYD